MGVENESSREMMETIRDHGWCAVRVKARPAGETEPYRPGYVYSVGFGLTRRAPEAAIFGLSVAHARAALWRLWDKDVDPAELHDGLSLDGVLKDRQVVVRRISATRHDAYFGAAVSSYNMLAEFGRLRLVQLVFPDNAGKLPWDPECEPRFRRAQPPLHVAEPTGGVDWREF